MDLYNPHSLLDEAVEVDSSVEGETSPLQNGAVPLSTLMQATPACPDDLDLEKIVVTGVLFIVAFFVLAPRSPKRLKRRVDSKERIHPGSPAPNHFHKNVSPLTCNNTATLCTSTMLHAMEDEEEETEEEKFVQNYPTIRTSPYRRLVLPPECKRVSVDTRILQQQKESLQPQKVQEELDEDHPIKRLRVYVENFLDLIRSILSYEYWNAAMTLIRWLRMCIRIRKRQQGEPEDEDDDDDDASQATGRASLDPTNSPFHSPRAGNDPVSPIQEEKKDMNDVPYDQQQKSEGSVCHVPLNDVGESDVGEKPVPPPSFPRLGSQKKSGIIKRKDALESYRGGSSSQGAAIGQTAPLSPKVPPPAPFNSHITLDVAEDAPERELSLRAAVHSRTESEHSMSYFDAAHSKDVIKKMAVAVPVPDRNGYILGDEFLPNSRHTPLLVFVNSRAGPQQGHLLITQLRRLLNPIQVWDLANGGPEKILESFLVLTRLRILVCGGDGTVSWIICALEKMQLERFPPISILPLGTGNDLARIHGWGGGYTNESLIVILEQIAEAYISLLDRWEMTVENKKGKVREAKAFTNYLGVGVDAQAALQVHMVSFMLLSCRGWRHFSLSHVCVVMFIIRKLRESMPKFFFSRFVNKAWYALFGAEDAIKVRTCVGM